MPALPAGEWLAHLLPRGYSEPVGRRRLRLAQRGLPAKPVWTSQPLREDRCPGVWF